MKILKLIGILLALIAMIVGAFIISNGDKGKTIEFPPTDSINVVSIRDEFIRKWENAKRWDKELHEYQRNFVMARKSNKQITKASYDALLNTIHENAIAQMCANYDKALKAETYDHKKITTAFEDVKAVKKAEGLDTLKTADKRISRIESINKYYLEAKNFAESSHYVRAHFNTENLTWTQFDYHKNYYIKWAQNLRNHTRYSEIKHIKHIAEGLSEKEVSSKVEKHRNRYYSDLYAQIVAHFDTVDITRENYQKLVNLHKRFRTEEAKYSRDLGSYINNFLDKVKELEKEKKY